jgi:hypothetical protein
MTLTPLVEKKEIKEAVDSFAKCMSNGSKPLTSTLGWQGGNIEAKVFWNESLRIWSHFDLDRVENRYWCVFGVQGPSKSSNLSITCEINFPKESKNRRVAGLFVRDNEGNVYITHNGNLRGGKKGVGGALFRKFIPHDQFIDIIPEDGEEFQNILIGRLEDPELPNKVANFIKSAESFKEKVATGELSKITDMELKRFSPEFSGQKEFYSKADIITSKSDHGIVVNCLQDLLEKTGLKATNDNFRDLFIYNNAGLMTILFEAKTDLSTSSIYSAIGQLMYYSASQDPIPKLVMVVPGKPKVDTKKILDRLGIDILQYKLEKGNVQFFGLDELLKR